MVDTTRPHDAVPGPGTPERGYAGRTFDRSTRLVIMSVPDDGMVVGTSGTPRVTVAQLVIETLSARGIAALIEGLDARGALYPAPSVLRTPTSVLTAESATGDTLATWGLAMDADQWLHQAFPLRAPDSMAPVLVTLPGGRAMVYPELAHSATPQGREEWERIGRGLAEATGGRRGRVTDPDDPFGGYDYAAPDDDD